MMIKKPKKYWVITEYDSLEKKNEWQYPFGYWSDSEMVSLLQRLATRDLTPDEIIMASLRRNIKDRAPLLEVQRATSGRYCLSIGGNTHYTAVVEQN